MKPIFEDFCCPQCGKLRHIKVNGICFDCSNENTLDTLAKQRKVQQKSSNLFFSLKIESYN